MLLSDLSLEFEFRKMFASALFVYFSLVFSLCFCVYLSVSLLLFVLCAGFALLLFCL